MNSAAELSTVIHNFLPSFNASLKLPNYKLRTLDALQKCRTEYMGGHIEVCEDCGEVRTAYNSCRNRHCPKCGAIDKEKWIISREADLLPVRYFHVVFTVPDTLNPLFLNNQQQMYNLLFRTSWDVLSDFGKTKKWAGGKLGATAILHTCLPAVQDFGRRGDKTYIIILICILSFLPGCCWKMENGNIPVTGESIFSV